VRDAELKLRRYRSVTTRARAELKLRRYYR
jgi:hypothetical protein